MLARLPALIRFDLMRSKGEVEIRENKIRDAFTAKIQRSNFKSDGELAAYFLANVNKELFEPLIALNEILQTIALREQAAKFDIDLPDDPACWNTIDEFAQNALTPFGRATSRKRIDEEKGRRFEVRSRWIKLLTPIIAAVAGLIGTITGLVAVLKK
jgi:hypothetical protein